MKKLVPLLLCLLLLAGLCACGEEAAETLLTPEAADTRPTALGSDAQRGIGWYEHTAPESFELPVYDRDGIRLWAVGLTADKAAFRFENATENDLSIDFNYVIVNDAVTAPFYLSLEAAAGETVTSCYGIDNLSHFGIDRIVSLDCPDVTVWTRTSETEYSEAGSISFRVDVSSELLPVRDPVIPDGYTVFEGEGYTITTQSLGGYTNGGSVLNLTVQNASGRSLYIGLDEETPVTANGTAVENAVTIDGTVFDGTAAYFRLELPNVDMASTTELVFGLNIYNNGSSYEFLTSTGTITLTYDPLTDGTTAEAGADTGEDPGEDPGETAQEGGEAADSGSGEELLAYDDELGIRAYITGADNNAVYARLENDSSDRIAFALDSVCVNEAVTIQTYGMLEAAAGETATGSFSLRDIRDLGVDTVCSVSNSGGTLWRVDGVNYDPIGETAPLRLETGAEPAPDPVLPEGGYVLADQDDVRITAVRLVTEDGSAVLQILVQNNGSQDIVVFSDPEQPPTVNGEAPEQYTSLVSTVYAHSAALCRLGFDNISVADVQTVGLAIEVTKTKTYDTIFKTDFQTVEAE